MTVTLRPYQEKLIAETRQALKVHRKVVVVSPTGSGKTNLSGFMMKGAAERDVSSMFIVHRKELVEQTGATMDRIGMDFGIVAAGFPFQPYKKITVASVGTLVSRLDKIPQPGLILLDEAHHASAGTWRTITDFFPNALYVGLTATPERLDGRGLDHLFKAIVPGPSVRWLIDNGYLAPFRIWSHPGPDLRSIKITAGDYNQGALEDAMDKPHLVGDIVQHYLQIANGTQAVAFCVSVKHAVNLAEAFRAAGVAAEEIDGAASKGHRSDVIARFRSGEIRVLTSIDLLGEGFDLPAMQTAILARPTASLGLLTQQVGRPLRPVYAPNMPLDTVEQRLHAIQCGAKPFAILLDHAGNIARHGLPDQERHWTLEGRKKKPGIKLPPMKQCTNCFGSLTASTMKCPHCGYVFESGARMIVEIEGKLQEIDLAQAKRMEQEIALKKAAKAEEARLRIISKERNYRVGWIGHRMRAWTDRERKIRGLD